MLVQEKGTRAFHSKSAYTRNFPKPLQADVWRLKRDNPSMRIADDMLFSIHMKQEVLKLQQHAGDPQHADALHCLQRRRWRLPPSALAPAPVGGGAWPRRRWLPAISALGPAPVGVDALSLQCWSQQRLLRAGWGIGCCNGSVSAAAAGGGGGAVGETSGCKCFYALALPSLLTHARARALTHARARTRAHTHARTPHATRTHA